MATNNLFVSTAPTNQAVNSTTGVLGSIGSVLNSLNSLALPLEQGVGNFSQLYTQIKQLNPQAQTPIPVNEAFYQAPANSLTGNFAAAMGNTFNQIPWYVWGIIIVAGVGIIAVSTKKG